MASHQTPETWRALQLRSAPLLDELLNRSLDERLTGALASLEDYLTRFVSTKQEAQQFLRMLPVVRRKCNEEIYDLSMAAEAYAYTHFADRYTRWWTVFHRLLDAGWFPMRASGIQVLDAGSGPASASYALIDFAASLSAVAASQLKGADASRIQTEPPRIALSESSVAMGRLVHQLSELRELRGPYHISFPDAFGIELARDKATNAITKDRLLREIQDEWETGPDGARYILNEDYPEWHKPQRFHLCMFSYLLTTETMMDAAVSTMYHIRRTLPPGGLVVVMGGGGEDYANINLRLRRHLNGLHHLSLSGPHEATFADTTRPVLKDFHLRVGQYILSLAGEPEQDDEIWLKDIAVQSMWDPHRLAPGRKRIGIEIYRARDSRGAIRKKRPVKS